MQPSGPAEAPLRLTASQAKHPAHCLFQDWRVGHCPRGQPAPRWVRIALMGLALTTHRTVASGETLFKTSLSHCSWCYFHKIVAALGISYYPEFSYVLYVPLHTTASLQGLGGQFPSSGILVFRECQLVTIHVPEVLLCNLTVPNTGQKLAPTFIY